MSQSLIFKIKDNVDTDKRKFIEIFFKYWIDERCHSSVHYATLNNLKTQSVGYRLDFDDSHDATAIKLIGVPSEFRKYMEMVQ